MRLHRLLGERKLSWIRRRCHRQLRRPEFPRTDHRGVGGVTSSLGFLASRHASQARGEAGVIKQPVVFQIVRLSSGGPLRVTACHCSGLAGARHSCGASAVQVESVKMSFPQRAPALCCWPKPWTLRQTHRAKLHMGGVVDSSALESASTGAGGVWRLADAPTGRRSACTGFGVNWAAENTPPSECTETVCC